MNLFVAADGDHIGALVGRARLQDDVGEIRRVDQAIRRGNDLLTAWAVNVLGSTVEAGGDEVLLEVPAEAVAGLEDVRRQYAAAVGATLSAGVGSKPSEASKALEAAKLRGRDRTVLYGADVEEEIQRIKENPSEAEKIAQEYLAPFAKGGDLEKARLDPSLGYTFSDRKPENDTEKLARIDHVVSAHHNGEEVGRVNLRWRYDAHSPSRGAHKPGEMSVYMVNVLPDHRRKGLASAMYAHAEKTLGRKIVPSELQSDAGKALWAGNAADKQFGKAEIAKSDANGTGHQPPQHPATHQPQGKDHDLAQLVDGFHRAANRQAQADQAHQAREQTDVDGVRQQVASALQSIQQQLPALQQVKSAFPQTYQAVVDLANATLALARAAEQAADGLSKAEKLPRIYRAGDLRVPSLDHPDRAAWDVGIRRSLEARWANGGRLTETLADLHPLDLGDPSTLDPRRVALYREMLANGDAPPPVVVDHDGSVLQGRHAAAAFRAEGRDAVPALVRAPLAEVEPDPAQAVPGGAGLDKGELPEFLRVCPDCGSRCTHAGGKLKEHLPKGAKMDSGSEPCPGSGKDVDEKVSKAVLDSSLGYSLSHENYLGEFRVYAHHAGKQVGYAVVDPKGRKEAVVHDVFVEPDHRRRGIASAMYTHAEKALGRKLIPNKEQMGPGRALWAGNAKNKQFGKSDDLDKVDVAAVQHGVSSVAPAVIAHAAPVVASAWSAFRAKAKRGVAKAEPGAGPAPDKKPGKPADPKPPKPDATGHLRNAHRGAVLPVGSTVNGEVKVRHQSGKVSWRSVREGMIGGTDPTPGLYSEVTHPVSARRPSST